MSGIDWAQVLNLLGIALVGAISALAAAYSKKAKNVQPMPLAAVDVRPQANADLIGGGAHEVAATLTPWYPGSYLPQWGQNDGTLPDGVPDPEHFNDCGETAVAMCVAGVHGCPIEPGAIRQYLQGPEGSGLTDGAALVRALRYYSTAAHVESIAGSDAWDLVSKVVAAQRPVIMLGRWPTPGLALHWMVAVSNGDGVVQYINPWTGGRSFLAKADWLHYEAGQLVVLDAHIHYDCRQWPTPS